MNLVKIHVENYRSIESLSFSLDEAEGISTIGLIGLNEAGKTNVLRALELTTKGRTAAKKDYKNSSLPIVIALTYVGHPQEVVDYLKSISVINDVYDERLAKLEKGILRVVFSYDKPGGPPQCEYHIEGIDGPYAISEVGQIPHKAVFWTSEPQYLISAPVPLGSFANNPGEVSIPLRNCFSLAGIYDIARCVSSIESDSTEVEHLEERLGDAVTRHIRAVWPDHPIQITFRIINNSINFHVRDEGYFGKANTADQRSDGFKQFVSFLLTVSAENQNEELADTILLLDEPETHLHPKAQEYLLGELIRITSNKRGNLAIFSTHSNYLIDKKRLDRYWNVRRVEGCTVISRFPSKVSTYASVAYDVFEVESFDYLNELYGRLHEHYMLLDENDEKRGRIQTFDSEFLVGVCGWKANFPMKKKQNAVTLPSYVRNCIHHPEGEHEASPEQLREAIRMLRKAWDLANEL